MVLIMAQKTALITGANKGIGFEVAKQLGSKEFDIILTGRNKQGVDAAAEQLQQQGISAVSLELDVTVTESIQSAFQQIRDKFDKIDVLVNNAGILLDESTPLLNISKEDFLQTFQTNAFSAFFMIQNFLPLLRPGSRIINVSSGGGQITNGITTWAPVYCMSKTTLNVITMQLAAALRSNNVVINAVCPGWVRTDMGGTNASRSVAKGAETITWLASEAPHSITGKFFRDKKEINW
jgi:NAD(P)-dependent dehydrogenase (short-subunit alcohol dehydrogenase family)